MERRFEAGLSAMTVATLLSACGPGVATPAAFSAPLAAPAMRRTPAASSREFVFTCQNGTVFDCLVYSERGELLRTKTKDVASPLGVAAGSDGLLYVANEFSDNVLVYTTGGRSLLHELDNGGNVPVDVAVFHDEVAVSNLHNVTVFKPGATKPTRTLTDRNVLQGSGVAFDAKGNCYWSLVTETPSAQVDEFAGCKGSPKNLNVRPGSPYGIAFDSRGNLYYTSFSSSSDGVYRCSGTGDCQLVYTQFVDPEYLNFSSDFKDLWINDPGSSSSGGSIDEIDIKTGSVVEKIGSGLSFFNPPSGVAVAPGPF